MPRNKFFSNFSNIFVLALIHKMIRKFAFLLTLCCVFSQAFSQVFTNKEVGKKNQQVIDSLKSADYPYALPIWGAKATAAGYNLPYSAGISVQYFTQESELVIDNLMVGFNNGPMYDLDGLVRFDKPLATASALTVRPDVWVLPFLNVYGILGKSQASTEVNFGVWIPDSTNTETEILNAGTTVDFSTVTAGFGITPTIGVGGGFLALDMNFSWTDVPQLKEPAFAFVFGPRFGKNFTLNKPERSFAVWAGGFRVKISSGTEGSLELSEVFNATDFNTKIDEAYIQIDDAQREVDIWWAGLSDIQQANPVNEAKYNSANEVLQRAGGLVSAAEIAGNNIANSSVQYSMDKRVKDMWNFIVGAQFQLNKHWMIRAEGGFLGSRSQLMGGLQYRFGL